MEQKVYSSFTTNADNVIIPDNSYFSEDNDKATVVTPLTLPVGHYEGFMKILLQKDSWI